MNDPNHSRCVHCGQFCSLHEFETYVKECLVTSQRVWSKRSNVKGIGEERMPKHARGFIALLGSQWCDVDGHWSSRRGRPWIAPG
jgi:hypothetical protein